MYSKSQMFEIVFDNFEPKLLDVMCAGEGRYYVYLGRKKFVQTKVKI